MARRKPEARDALVHRVFAIASLLTACSPDPAASDPRPSSELAVGAESNTPPASVRTDPESDSHRCDRCRGEYQSCMASRRGRRSHTVTAESHEDCVARYRVCAEGPGGSVSTDDDPEAGACGEPPRVDGWP